MDATTLKKLLNSRESSTLDFKVRMYDFDASTKKTADFIKDLISMANTIRDGSAHILFGVKDHGTYNEVIGIDSPIDDEFLQSKVKDKITPRVDFKYENHAHEGKTIGVIEIPLRRYNTLITPTVKMKGVEVQKAYHRKGTSNVECNAVETVEIHKWITSVSSVSERYKLSEELDDILLRLTDPQKSLTETLIQARRVAQKYLLSDLNNFCEIEFKGVKERTPDIEALKYRVVNILISPFSVNITSFGGAAFSSEYIRNEMLKKEEIIEGKMLRTESISDIEAEATRRKNESGNSIYVEKRKHEDFSEDPGEFRGHDLYIYTTHSTYEHLVERIKRHLRYLINECYE